MKFLVKTNLFNKELARLVCCSHDDRSSYKCDCVNLYCCEEDNKSYDDRYRDYLKNRERAKNQLEGLINRRKKVSLCCDKCQCTEPPSSPRSLSPRSLSPPSASKIPKKKTLPPVPDFDYLKCPRRHFPKRALARSPPPPEREKLIENNAQNVEKCRCDDYPPKHRCVHQFIQNEYFILEPVNPNCLGLSCCKICGKSIQLPKLCAQGIREIAKACEPKKDQRQLRKPKVFCLLWKDMKIELIFEDCVELCGCVSKKKKYS